MEQEVQLGVGPAVGARSARSTRAEALAALACSVVDGLPSPVLIVDGTGAPLLVNRAAARHLAAGDGLLVRRRVDAVDLDSSLALGQAIAAATAETTPAAAVVRVVRRAPHPPLPVVVAPLRGTLLAGGGEARGAVLAFHDPDASSALDDRLLRRYFALTPTEARVTLGLAGGHSLRDIAASHGMALGTVRWHLKRVLPKLDVRSQAELVAQVLCSPLRLVGLLPTPSA